MRSIRGYNTTKWRTYFGAAPYIMAMSEMSEHEQRMSADFIWAENAAEVQQNPEHFGKLVAVYDKRVVGFGRDRQALVEQAAKKIGVPAQHLVVVLVPRPGLWEIPH